MIHHHCFQNYFFICLNLWNGISSDMPMVRKGKVIWLYGIANSFSCSSLNNSLFGNPAISDYWVFASECSIKLVCVQEFFSLLCEKHRFFLFFLIETVKLGLLQSWFIFINWGFPLLIWLSLMCLDGWIHFTLITVGPTLCEVSLTTMCLHEKMDC